LDRDDLGLQFELGEAQRRIDRRDERVALRRRQPVARDLAADVGERLADALSAGEVELDVDLARARDHTAELPAQRQLLRVRRVVEVAEAARARLGPASPPTGLGAGTAGGGRDREIGGLGRWVFRNWLIRQQALLMSVRPRAEARVKLLEAG